VIWKQCGEYAGHRETVTVAQSCVAARLISGLMVDPRAVWELTGTVAPVCRLDGLLTLHVSMQCEVAMEKAAFLDKTGGGAEAVGLSD
jgi:hypothetical protein